MTALSTLVTQINDAHTAYEATAKAAGEKAWECGQLLLAAKKQVKHGQWEPWVKENCTFSTQHAHKYMQIGRLNLAHVRDLSMREALAEAVAEAASLRSEEARSRKPKKERDAEDKAEKQAMYDDLDEEGKAAWA